MRSVLGSGFCFLILIVLCICHSGYPVSAQNRRPKNIQVALRAKWSGTPLLLEAGELLSKEWKDYFWDFTDSWIHSVDKDSDFNTAKDCLKKIVEYGKSLLSEPLSSVFEFSLTLRSASPRLVLYRQLAEESLSSFPLVDEISSNTDGGTFLPNETASPMRSESFHSDVNPSTPGNKCCWVDTGGSLFSDVTELQPWLQNPSDETDNAFQQPEIFEFDHVHPDSSSGSPITVLYGALGTECFKDFHLVLAEAAKKGKVKYVVRSVLPSGCEPKIGSCGAIGTGDSLNLGGYGVELALKNMEYKAMDDSTIRKGVTLEDPHTEDLSQEVRGFIFSRILVRSLSFHRTQELINHEIDTWNLR